MEDKIKNTIIIAILAFFFIIISVVFGQLNKESEKKVDLKKDKPQQTAPTQTTTPPADTNQPVADTAISGTDSITTNNYANQTLSYFYYIPQNVLQNKQARHPYLILVSGLNGQGQDFTTQTFKDFANQYGFVILAPSFTFDEKNSPSKTSYQYPIAWSGKALNDILNSFMAKQGLKPSRLYMLGFSTGAQFALRYSMLYPDYVTACVIISTEDADMPTTYQATRFLVSVGTQDEQNMKQKSIDFYNAATAKKINIGYKEYNNTKNQLSNEEIQDALLLFEKINEAG